MDTNPTIRRELPQDIESIRDLVTRAFKRDAEATLVTLIRERGEAVLSLVAVNGGTVVGHVLASPITITPNTEGTFLGIAPLSVLPAAERRGIGASLMNSVIHEARGLGVSALFLLGNPHYYSRFGFTATHIGNEYGATDAFMALALKPNCLENVAGVAHYVSAFDESGT